jgi:N-formylmaleamate deformylase
MPKWTDGYVTSNGFRMHYYHTGGDKPALVLSHGMTDDGLCWTRLARALEADYDVIMPDSRGHGRSEMPPGEFTWEDLADDLAGLIRGLGLSKPIVGGHSLGGATANYLAANHASLVSRVFLEDPPFWPVEPTPEQRASFTADMRSRAAARLKLTYDQIVAEGRGENPGWAVEEFDPWADAKQRVRVEAVGIGSILDKQTWREALSKITCPALLITSDPERGGIVTPEIAAEARRLLPALRVARMSGAGHNIRREAFDAYVTAVREFLR